MAEDQADPSVRQLYRMLSDHFAAFRRRIVLGGVVAVAASLFEVGVVFSIAVLGTMMSQSVTVYKRDIFGHPVTLHRATVAIGALAFVIIRGLLDYFGNRINFETAARYGFNKRMQLMRAFLRADWRLQSGETAGLMQTGIWSNISQARSALQTTSDAATAGAGLAVMLVASFLAGGLATIVVIAIMAALAGALTPVMRATRRASVEVREVNLEFAEFITEAAALTREIRVFGMAEPVEERTRTVVSTFREASLASDLMGLRLSVTYTNAIYLTVVGGLVVLVWLQIPNPTPYAAMVLLLYRAFGYGRGLQSGFQNLVRTAPYVESVDSQLERYLAAEQHYGDAELAPLDSVAFRNVTFAYEPGQPVIHDLSFEVGRGEAIGIVGPSGGGKSTLVQLLLRLQQPDSGHYEVNGREASDYAEAEFVSRVTLVPQDPVLFDQSVLDNVIAMRSGVSADDARSALAQAHLLEEIETMPEGLGTLVGDRGSRLSGGQRQRLCIARALAGRPDLIILDEPTSSLDPHSESAISDTLENLRGQVTLLVVAHRLSTVRLCDRIMVLRHGRMEAFGTHGEVEAQSTYFAESLRLSRLV